MKKIQFLILCLFMFTAIAVAQQKKYVSYTVKKGETMKSIAKDYQMSRRNLLRLNPGVRKKPKPNTVIIVPNLNYGKEVIVPVNEEVKSKYIVEPKETLFGISRMFGVSIAALKEANPMLSDGLKIGMVLDIPSPTITMPKDSVDYVLHKVVKDDTKFNLTRRYEVTEEGLLRLNPILKEGLKLGMLLKIKPIDILKNDDIENEFGEFTEDFDLNKEINVVLMLPYHLNKTADSIRVENFEKRNSLLNIATDFHLGASMAIDSLKAKGVRINTRFFDTENSNYKLLSIVNDPYFKKADIVIGPLFFDKARWVSKKTNAPVLTPLFSKKQRSVSPTNIIKSAPDTKLFEERLLTYMEEVYQGEDIIVINDGLTESQSNLWRIVNKLKAFDSIQQITVVKPEKGYIKPEKITKKIKEDKGNWVLLISDENVATAAAVNSLKIYIEGFNVTLFSLNKGKNFDKIDNHLLGQLNFTFATADYLDEENSFVQRFYEKYQDKNYSVPSKYSIRGFDVTYDVLARIASSGNLEAGLKAGHSSRLSSVFQYDKKLFGSFENKGVYLIRYNTELNPVVIEEKKE